MNSVYPCWKDDLTLTFSRLSQQGIEAQGREELSDRGEKRKGKHTQTHRKAIILELSAKKPCATTQQQKYPRGSLSALLPVRSHFKAFRTFAEFERNVFCLTLATSEMPGA